MATAKLTTTEEKVVTVVRQTGVCLELSAEEAVFLANVLAPMSGGPEYTARKYRNSIVHALSLVDIKYDEVDYKKVTKENIMYFNEESKMVVDELANTWKKTH